jgi:protease-4
MTDQDNPSGNISNSDDVWTKGPEIKESAKQSVSASRVSDSGGNNSSGEWERDVLNRLAFASLNEQRRSRRWSIFFKSLLFIYLFALLFYIPTDFDGGSITPGKHTAIIDLDGVIAPNMPANADSLMSGLRDAFKNKNTVAVILRINSPGGSPVQAGYVYDEIKRLRKKYPDKKLYAVVQDICASGGYYIASAADEIYADKASIVGSIGVLMDGFGFVKTLDKLGVERRLMTAGDHKGILDPFSPLKKDEVKHVQGLLDSVHQQFISKVKEGRGDRLSSKPEIFSGLFWNGEDGMKLGLVDGLGDSSYVAREIIGEEKIVDYTPRLNYFDRFADRFGAALANVLASNAGMGQAGLR